MQYYKCEGVLTITNLNVIFIEFRNSQFDNVKSKLHWHNALYQVIILFYFILKLA